jgi:hypothetical protein
MSNEPVDEEVVARLRNYEEAVARSRDYDELKEAVEWCQAGDDDDASESLNGDPCKMSLLVQLTALEMDGTPDEAAEVIASLIQDALSQHDDVVIKAMARRVRRRMLPSGDPC